MKYITPLFAILLMLVSCKEDPQEIVDRAIEAAGSDKLDQKEVLFDFREYSYRSVHDGSEFELERIIPDSSGIITDRIDNKGFTRLKDGELVELEDTTAGKYRNSVNSVHYFAYLPKGLNDPAVNKEYLGEVVIEGEPYHKLKVTFDQQGGGEDFEDVFLYWINKKSYKVDYLAYEYHTNGGGMRFREVYNRRNIGGIDFVDYRNFKPASKEASLMELDSLFEEDALELLSLIELKNVKVNPCTDC
ncbi:DUF6503 family protein [Robertkochia aurantiaca]|uniref:DUF6503 family protein n=1 Tax=Robertkochia aurantiaca TaxID=2873700 RepID=UPI001CCB85E9|nr:DUF6503 family protein [Robertkochia sp. 3YJGBD-33]